MILIRSPHSGPRQYLTYPEPGCFTGATEGCAEMVTGSPSSPLVAKILVQLEAEANIQQSRYVVSGVLVVDMKYRYIIIFQSDFLNRNQKSEEKVSWKH